MRVSLPVDVCDPRAWTLGSYQKKWKVILSVARMSFRGYRDKQAPPWSISGKGELHSAVVKMSKLLMCTGTSVAESQGQHTQKKPALQGHRHMLWQMPFWKRQNHRMANRPVCQPRVGGAFEVSWLEVAIQMCSVSAWLRTQRHHFTPWSFHKINSHTQ